MRTWKLSRLGSLSFALLCLIAAGPACTRSTTGQTTVQLQLPSVQDLKNSKNAQAKDITMTANSVYHVIVLNITASDISTPVFYQWQNQNDDAPVVTPTSVTLSVPTGDSRLVQALALIDDKVAGTSTIYYGHATLTVQSGTNSVTVTMNAEPGAETINSNDQIVGRYIRSDGTGPTGHISAFYSSVNYPDDPLMLVDNSTEIIAGWFRVFAMGFDASSSTNGIVYHTDDGTSLFSTSNGNRVDLNHLISGQDLGVTSLYNQALVVDVPASCYSSDDVNFNNCNLATRTVYGFFGPKVEATNVAGSGFTPYQVCYPPGGSSPSYDIPNLYAADSGHAQLDWYASSSQAGEVYESGGQPVGGVDSNGFCAPSDQIAGNAKFNTYLSFNFYLAGSNNMALGFQGPFRRMDSLIPASSTTSTLYSQYTYSAGTGSGSLTVKWQLLPGTPAVISGVDLFVRAGNSDKDVQTNNGFDCTSLVKDGYQNIASVATTSDDTNIYSQTVTLSGTLAASLYVGGTLIACPYVNVLSGSNKVYFSSSVDSRIQGI